MWNPSTCDCECNNTCKTDKYLDVKKLILKIVRDDVIEIEDSDFGNILIDEK